MAENLTPKKYIDNSNMKQILTAVKNEIHSDDSIITTEAEYLALPEEQKLNNSYYLYDIGVHYKNGVAYSRKKPIQLTMEEYKALGEVDPDQEYIVSADEQGILLGAEDIGYNNAESGIQATTVQGAIDKVVKTVEDKVDKTAIATTIDGTSTDTQVPSAKAVWNKSKNKIQALGGTDIIVYADSISNEMVTDTVRIMNATNSPYGVDNVNNDFYYTIYNIDDDEFKRILAYDIRKNDMYMIMKKDGVWGTWQRVCTTKVADVPFTKLTLDSSVFTLYDSSSYISYIVRNGMCTITCKGLGLVSAGIHVVASNIPKPVGGYATNILQVKSETMVPTNPVFLTINNNELKLFSESSTGAFWGTVTYPVAES